MHFSSILGLQKCQKIAEKSFLEVILGQEGSILAQDCSKEISSSANMAPRTDFDGFVHRCFFDLGVDCSGSCNQTAHPGSAAQAAGHLQYQFDAKATRHTFWKKKKPTFFARYKKRFQERLVFLDRHWTGP